VHTLRHVDGVGRLAEIRSRSSTSTVSRIASCIYRLDNSIPWQLTEDREFGILGDAHIDIRQLNLVLDEHSRRNQAREAQESRDAR
jgi:hypothetical protein